MELNLRSRNHLQQLNKLKRQELFLRPPEIFGETGNNYRTGSGLRTARRNENSPGSSRKYFEENEQIWQTELVHKNYPRGWETRFSRLMDFLLTPKPIEAMPGRFGTKTNPPTKNVWNQNRNTFPVHHWKDENYLTDHMVPENSGTFITENTPNENRLTAKHKRKRELFFGLRITCVHLRRWGIDAGQARNVKLHIDLML